MSAILLLGLLALAADSPASKPVEADVVIRGGLIHDGSDKVPFVGDVAIKKDQIVGVGSFETVGSPKIIDAKGLIVAPGFIDLHNHSDFPITKSPTRSNLNFLRQGCTTIVTGNCGGGVVDVEKYFRDLDANGAGTHVIHLMPQGSVRAAVMGTVKRPPTEAEIEKMRQLVDKGMRDGAFGMSTGLIYLPGAFSSTDEIAGLAKVVAEHGGIYASHIRNEGTAVLQSVEEAITIGAKGGCPVHISHLKASGPAAWGLGNDICNLIAAHRAKGTRVTADQYPYAASSTSLEATIIPTTAREGGTKELLARLDDKETGPKLLKQIAADLESRGGGSRIQIARCAYKPEWVGKNIQQIAQETKQSPLDVCLAITRNGGAAVINFGMSDEDVRLISTRDFVATASDGGAQVFGADQPHPRSYGTFPRKIGEFAHRLGWLSVPQAIRSSSGLPADILSLKDRGYLRTGMVADVVVFDLEKLKDHATYQKPHQFATGFKRVYVAGQEAVVDDVPTNILAGRPIRRVASASDSTPAAENKTGFARWEKAIAAFEAEDKQSPPPKNAVIFVGSSSIRLWDVAKSFPDVEVINRGFGGSQIADSVHFAPRIVTPHEPRLVLLYAGDNDLFLGKTPEQALADFEAFVSVIHEKLPRTKIAFIAIKPSIRRWALVEKIKAANALIAAACEKDERLTYLDVFEPMLGSDGKPRPELFVKDGLHLSEKGYAVWADVVRPHLQ